MHSVHPKKFAPNSIFRARGGGVFVRAFFPQTADGIARFFVQNWSPGPGYHRKSAFSFRIPASLLDALVRTSRYGF
jgi:hypothetical protein